jgi:ABC-type amino acid transport substrate-binding protein
MLLLASLGVMPSSASWNDARELQTQSPLEISTESCDITKIQRDPYIHKDKYIVAVVPTSRPEETIAATTIAFQDYLTATAGQMFDPPIAFEVVTFDFDGELEAVKNHDIDFLWANSGDYSCVGSQYGATALVTVSTSPSFHLGCCVKISMIPTTGVCYPNTFAVHKAS